MITGLNRFNIYLSAVVALGLLSGCQTKAHKKEKEVATLRLHIEVIPESMDFSTSVPIYRQNPVLVPVDKSPFLTEANVSAAKVVDVAGGFDLRVQFDREGSWLLESFTTTNPRKHIGIFSAFADGTNKQGRWLAAPMISRRISNGVLSFVPDASREEAETIARGLNNVAKQNQGKSKW